MKFIFSCVLVLLSLGLFAQNCEYSIQGTVRDKHTDEGVPFAKISIADRQINVLTDSAGNFVIHQLCAGKATLRCIPHFGCEPVWMDILIPLESIIEFIVETHALDLDEIAVDVFRFSKESQNRMTIETNDLSKISGNTLGEQLSRVPGLTTLNTGSSIVKPVINGMHSNRLVVVNNGIRQEGQQWGSEHAPEIDPNLASTLEVIQGASGLQYGPDAIGGVIIVSPEKLRYTLPLSAWIKLGGNSNGKGGYSSALVSGSLFKSGKLAYRIHGTGRMNGTQSTPEYLLKNTALKEFSFSAAVGYRDRAWEVDAFYSRFTTNLGIFTGSHIGNLTDLNNAFQADKPSSIGKFTYQLENPKQFVQHHLSRLNVLYRWNENISTSLIAGYQYNLRQEYDLHKGYNDSIKEPDLPAFELNLWTNTLELKTEIKHSKFLKSFVGISGLKQSNAYAGRFFVPNFIKTQIGAYYTGIYEKSLWSFDYGIRYDFSSLSVFIYDNNELTNPEKRFQNASYSLGLSRVMGHHWIVRFNLGSAWRPPSINELYSDGLHHGAASIEIGDDQLEKEIVYNAQFGIEYKSNFARINLSGFYNYFDGYINLQPSLPPALTIAGAFPVFNYRQSNVRFYGINGQFEIPIVKWLMYQAQGNILIADDLDFLQPVYGIPSNRLTQRLKYTYTFPKDKWNAFIEIEGLNVFQQTRFTENMDYVNPPDAYFLLNCQAGISKKISKEQTLQFIVSCSNLTNKSYRDYMNRFRYFADDLGRNWNFKVLIPINLKQNKK